MYKKLVPSWLFGQWVPKRNYLKNDNYFQFYFIFSFKRVVEISTKVYDIEI